MKNKILYYWMCLLTVFIISIPANAQPSPLATNNHGEKALRKEEKRERTRARQTEKKSANAEDKLSGKPQYKDRTKAKVKHEKAPSEKRRKKKSSESRD